MEAKINEKTRANAHFIDTLIKASRQQVRQLETQQLTKGNKELAGKIKKGQ